MRKQTFFKPKQSTSAKKANNVLTFKLIPYYGFEYIDSIDAVRNFIKTVILPAKCVLMNVHGLWVVVTVCNVQTRNILNKSTKSHLNLSKNISNRLSNIEFNWYNTNVGHFRRQLKFDY